jgi:hypothetical protein
MANGDGETVDDSKWATYNFTREYETGLRYQLINNNTEYELIGGGTAAGDVVMESTFRGKPVTSIAAKALYSNSKITSLTVGANVKTIGDKAFGKCSKLTSLTIPEGVTSIGADLLQNCKVITSITLPDSIKVVPTQAFFGCDLLANVTLGQYVTTISDRAFYGCKSLVSIGYTGCDKGSYQACLPNTVKSLGEYAFSGCIELVNINLGNGVETINSYAFNRCEKLENINLGTSLTALGDFAFFECIALKSIAIPDATTLIGKGAFLNGKPIQVSDRDFRHATICTAASLYSKDLAEPCFDILKRVYYQADDFRRFGTAVLELAYLAAGRIELFFEMRLFPWDMAAGLALIQEAGGFVEILHEEGLPLNRPAGIIASNSRENFEKLREIVYEEIPEKLY